MDNNKRATGLFLFLIFAASTCVGKFVTIDAAIRIDETRVNLFVGDKRASLSRNKVIYGPYERSDYYIPQTMHLKAAVESVSSHMSNFYYGDKYGYFYNYGNKSMKKLRYGRKRSFLRDSAVDAAARKGDKVYFFKGCDMVIRHKWNKWGQVQDMRTLGLPCHVDAAWKEGDEGMTLVRGDQIWMWNGDGSVDCPTLFNATYTFWSSLDWQLAPYSG